MQSTIEVFRSNAGRARDLGGLYDAISSLMTSALDPSDLLRAQIVLIVSALDYFVHEITIRGMLEVFDGLRAPTVTFKKHKISAELLIISPLGSRSAFEADIRERHSFLSFQQPDKVADAFRLFYADPLWPALAIEMNISDAQLKTSLRLIVDRRNKIAHEADADPSFPSTRWPICRKDGQDALDFVVKLCEAMYLKVKL